MSQPSKRADVVSLGGAGGYDDQLYGGEDEGARYGAEVMEEEEEEGGALPPATRAAGGRAASLPQRVIAEMRAEMEAEGASVDPMAEYRAAGGSGLVNTRITDRESSYHARRHLRKLSPERGDAFSDQGATRDYADILKEQQLAREKAELLRKLEKQRQEGILVPAHAVAAATAAAATAAALPASTTAVAPSSAGVGATLGSATTGRKRRRWDDAPSSDMATPATLSGESHVSMGTTSSGAASTLSAAPVPSVRQPAGEEEDAAPSWEAALTPSAAARVSAGDADATPQLLSSTGGGATAGRRTRWDETPSAAHGVAEGDATPAAAGGRWESGSASVSSAAKAKRSRWDETPLVSSGAAASSSLLGAGDATPMLLSAGAATPLAYSGATPTPSALAGSMTPNLAAAGGMTPGGTRTRAEMELDERNRPLTDEELDAMFPPGYAVMEPPASYVPLRSQAAKLMATPTPAGQSGFHMAATPARESYGVPAAPEGATGTGAAGDLPFIKQEDMQYFGALTEKVDEDSLTAEEAKRRRIMKLLLKIKCGSPPQRKSAMRQITDKARELGAAALFDQLLPLLVNTSLEDQERHVLVKVIDRVMYKLDELVRPYVHKILFVIQPMLIDEDYYARVEGRELISNLAKAAGLATMIYAMRPDIDDADEQHRNTTARAFAVVASALGVPALLPFLKAVCASKKTWQARHTGVRIVQQIAILLGCAVLPHLKMLVDIIVPSLSDEHHSVRIMGALAVAALAESAHPYGIDAFDKCYEPLWNGVRMQRGKSLAAFLKAVGQLIPLLDAEYAFYFSQKVMVVVIREFASPDDDMKKIVLKVVQQCVSVESVTAEYVRTQILPEFFRNFWVRRMALDRRNYKSVVSATVALAKKVGAADALSHIVQDLKDESEPYRRMVMEAVEQIVEAQGVSSVDERLEMQLMDGMLYAFQEQGLEENNKTVLNGFGAVVSQLGVRCKPYLLQICSTIKWRLNNKASMVRMQSADLITKIAPVIRQCGDEELLGHLGVVLFECLGEEYPDVLASILDGLHAIVTVVGVHAMQPPIRDLLPRLTPILKNRQERVQESSLHLVGRIADRGASMISPKEWMRICFDLLELLKAPRKSIRRASINTFGYIAKAIGPQDVLHALLNNLKVQERQMRVCTTVAIAVVAESCQPFTILPGLLNEYRIPDYNVQKGVLKSLSFVFEYIGSMAKDYVYAVTPLLVDALIERDPVYRQTACFTIKHLALGLQGLGCEDALQHLLNHVWPNVFETYPHVIQSVFEALEGMRVSLGPHYIFQYLLQGLFHPARRVREAYWKVYNNLYVYSADALTPLYPRIPDEGANKYARTYLELVV